MNLGRRFHDGRDHLEIYTTSSGADFAAGELGPRLRENLYDVMEGCPVHKEVFM